METGDGAVRKGRTLIDWGPMRRDVETTNDSLKDIAARHGQKYNCLTSTKSRHGWLRPGEEAKRAKAQEEVADPLAAMERWSMKVASAFDRTAALDTLIERRIEKGKDPDEMLKLHERRLAVLERSVRCAERFRLFLQSRAEEAESECSDPISELERQIFARAGFEDGDAGGDQEPDAG